MTPLDGLLVVIRWVHALAAVAWVGGGMFYLLVLLPAAARSPLPAEAASSLRREFRGLVHTALAVLLVTGIVLSVSRLTGRGAGVLYMAVLAVKVALALYMFYVVRFLPRGGYSDQEPAPAAGRQARLRRRLTGAPALLVLGVIVFGLSDLLDALFEAGLSR